MAADRRLTVLLLAAMLLSGCSGIATSSPRAVAPLTLSSTGAPAGSSAADPTAQALRLAQQAIGEFNATAGGPVVAQQSVLNRLVSTGQRQVQDRCPQPTTTISFDPVYARLAPSPGWRSANGTLPGVLYALPTLIHIYTGNRITGTDLTDLHLSVDAGRVTFPALCVH